jgi:hypothetical protein
VFKMKQQQQQNNDLWNELINHHKSWACG